MPPGLSKKLGPLKVWQWALIGAALGAAIVVYRRGKGGEGEGEPTGELFGGTGTGAYGALDPETGIPYAFEGAGGAGGESLDTFLANIGKLGDAGLLPTGGEGGEPGEGPIETIITETINPAAGGGAGKKSPPGQRSKAKAAAAKRAQGNQHPATSTGAAAAAGGNSHASGPHPAQRQGLGGAVGLTGPGKGTVQSASGGGVTHVGGAGGATGGTVHPAAYSSGIGAGHTKPGAPSGYHTYKGDNGQWWFAPN